jgi:hypothetical protein
MKWICLSDVIKLREYIELPRLTLDFFGALQEMIIFIVVSILQRNAHVQVTIRIALFPESATNKRPLDSKTAVVGL